ncbi:hypothetical protein [Sphingomonas sp. TREG-RG-20F-R18-01]|uniref:hypothetical protein n=1 Tax=Sphingomonas sp. TREG-RG-20F-R18-01 TaxID=2914982 RepID=UPI001F572F96|nr:hypothetical protein [Sphingomonas sp. TREG-RG-20F-R18-01]
MNAPQNRQQFLRSIENMDALNRQAARARAAAGQPESLWMSAALTLGVGLVAVCLVVARAWLG